MRTTKTLSPATPQGVGNSIRAAMPNMKDLVIVRGTANGNVVVALNEENPLMRDAVRRSGLRVQIRDALKGKYSYQQSNGRFYVRGKLD